MKVWEKGETQRRRVAGAALAGHDTGVARERSYAGVRDPGIMGSSRRPPHSPYEGNVGKLCPRRILAVALGAVVLAQPTFASEGCPWVEAVVRAHGWTMEGPASPFRTAPLRLGSDLPPAREPPARTAADEAWRTLSPGLRGVRL
jgi:hypothetical protein